MSIRYLLDTNTVSLALRGKAPRAVERLRSTPRDTVAVSVITAMELRFGLVKNPGVRVRSAVERFLETMTVAPIERSIEAVYGELRGALERRGRPIGALDTIIAAHAMSLGAALVTNNTREFSRVRNLSCEDWTRAR